MTVRAYAKVNLTLEVFGKRPDGFHALRSVVLPIGLADTLIFTPAGAFATDTGYPDDLILKAARALASTLRLRPSTSTRLQPYSIHVDKRIPAGGGLGGGSADAAAALLALNELWQLGKSPEELAEIGARVGSDVPALVLANHYRQPVLMQGRGEEVSLLNPSAGCPHPASSLHLVLANPGVPCRTAAIYARCSAREDDGGLILTNMRVALESNDISQIAAALVNDLQAPAIATCPAVDDLLASLREAGAIGAMMSGSGSTVFGFAPTERKGREIVQKLRQRGVSAWMVVGCPTKS